MVRTTRRRTTRRYQQNSLRYLASFHWLAMVRKNSFLQLCRMLHAALEWKRLKVICRSRPFAFRIEAAAVCNLRCPLCSTTYREFQPGAVRLMTAELFTTIFRKIETSASRITFYMEGEPLMNPRLFDMVKLTTARKRIFTSFSTNLTLLRERHLSALFQSGIDWISVSLDGFRQSTYEQYRVNGNVQAVLDGIRMIMASRRQQGLNRPYVEVNMIDFFHIQPAERRELADFCADQGVDEFRIRPDNFGRMGPRRPREPRKPSAKCYWPWISMSIDCDGSTYACPVAFEQRISSGNLATQSLDEIWNGPMYVATRTYLGRTGDNRDDLPTLPCFNCRWFGKTPPLENEVPARPAWMPATLHLPARQGPRPAE